MTSTAKPDYWSLLGLSPDSDLKQLKRAFREEARKWHPDLNNNDENAEERFKLINEAYAILSDPRKRIAWEKNNQFTNTSDAAFKNSFPTYEEYISIVLGLVVDKEESFNDLEDQEVEEEYDNEISSDNNAYWPTQSATPPLPIKIEEDIETLINLTVEEALNGALVEIELADGTVVEIATPPFSGDGWRLRLAGIASGNRDHFVQLRVQTEEGLRIDGLRVLYRLELFPPDALLGTAIEVPTLTGPVTLQVPPKSSSGRLLRLRGRGLKYEDMIGDQFVEIVVVMPSDITDAEYALYSRLQELTNNYE